MMKVFQESNSSTYAYSNKVKMFSECKTDVCLLQMLNARRVLAGLFLTTVGVIFIASLVPAA